MGNWAAGKTGLNIRYAVLMIVDQTAAGNG